MGPTSSITTWYVEVFGSIGGPGFQDPIPGARVTVNGTWTVYTDSGSGNRGNFLVQKKVKDRAASQAFDSFRIVVEMAGYAPIDTVFPAGDLRTDEAGNGLSSNGTRWIIPTLNLQTL